MKKILIVVLVSIVVVDGSVQAAVVASQNFDADIFSTGAESGATYFNGMKTHTSTGDTDMGFTHDGLVSTSESGTAGVVDGAFQIIHYSATHTGSDLDFGNPRTGAFHFEPISFLFGYTGKTFSMDIHDIGSNTTDDDVVVRLLINGATTVTLLDTRPQANGTAGTQTLSHNFADTDTSVQLLIDILSDDAGDGYGIDNIEITGFPDPDAPAFNTDPISGADARATVVYVGSISGEASDLNGDQLEYGKAAGPSWLTVATNGILGGTPDISDMGLNQFTVSVTDNQDGSDTAQLSIQVNDPDGNPPLPDSNTGHYRLIWDSDPTSTATVAWKQISGANGTVYYGTEDLGRAYASYPSQKSVDRTGSFISSGTINSCFAYLSGLQPDTAYYFVIKDEAGVSPRFWFLTAPDSAKPFTFVAGGDSRSYHDPRRKANRMVAKIRPLFVIFTGDMINTSDASSWNTWFEDWQETTSNDGRVYPLIPHRGNHEGLYASNNNAFYQLFDTTENNYYSFSIGGNLLRFYVLNSEMDDNATLWNTQTSWLENDLTANAASHTHLSAGYHKPMRPHVSGKPEGIAEYNAWAQLFYDSGMDLVFEADSHTTKRTWPIKPFTGTGSDEGFIRDDANGTVYSGEGCWGAPLRDADDTKTWTRAAGVFNSFDWVHVYPSYMELFTIKVDTSDDVGNLQEGDVFSLPFGIDLWAAANGSRMIINNQGITVLKSYAQWQLDQWGIGAIPANTEALGDFDGDGYNNMTEFSYGLDPTVSETAGAGVFPVIAVGGADQIRINYRREMNTSLNYVYEFSNDLITWTPMVAETDYSETLTPAGDNELLEIELLGDHATAPEGFLRIKFGIQ